MPLPSGGQTWPPTQLADILPTLAEYDAWYVGDPDKLRNAYTRGQGTPTFDRTSQYRGGVAGAVARLWWGRPVGDLTKRQYQLHVPIAGDLCQGSADLLFAQPPTLRCDDKTAQKELDTAADDGLLSTLAEGAEVAAALSGVFMRVTWDAAVADRSFFTAVHADAAWPEFRWGRLVAVTFWREVLVDGQRVMRHLERHELDNNGIGIVQHGLYEGGPENLGHLVPLTEHTATRALATEVDADGVISTESPGLAVEYVPNQRPQRKWRTHPVGANLGRSDLDGGVIPLMDALDETYSSWMRDIRLAKGRIITPEYMLTSMGTGRGAAFDLEQDVFTPVKRPPTEDGKGELTISQFQIRVEEHQRTAQQLVEDILRTAGYSRATFGEDADGGMKTATEVRAEQSRSLSTRSRKIRHWRPALSRLLEKKLAVDAAIFRTGVTPLRPEVDFGDAVQADPESLARTNQALFTAQAASAETRVRLQHPDWDEQQVADETDRILSEFSVAVPDPAAFNPATA